ncbi:uncharacterized protein LOC108744101 [Agrilus planipennis]|uniref:Uncharacterized protein LOC108744101 n=1 Tax=Agrilus planipennis TaxID=224129 RepID=A0A7F5RE35_AGRPL|nr:uncharacterized protein LOC108744101 [Agrilus planipennis]
MNIPILLLVFLKFASCANILAHFITPSMSHQSVYRNIWKELSLRGHKITVITPYPLKDPLLVNLTEIDVNFSYEIIKEAINSKKLSQEQKIDAERLLNEIIPPVLDCQLEEPRVKEIYNGENNETYDLVLVEMIYPVVYPLAQKYRCPYVGIASFSGAKVFEIALGNPAHPVAYPDVLLEYSAVETFFQRLHSTFFDIRTYLRLARVTTLRTLLVVINIRNPHTRQLNVKNAFLIGELQEEIYMKQPLGVSKQSDLILASRNRSTIFVSVNLTGDKKIYLLIYDEKVLLQITRKLGQQCRMKDLGQPNFFLDIKIERDATALRNSNCNGINTPVKPKSPSETNSESIIEIRPYRELVGCRYLIRSTRPDLSAAINFYSRFQSNAAEAQWTGFKRILQYLQATRDCCLYYPKDNPEPLALGQLEDQEAANSPTLLYGGREMGFHFTKPVTIYEDKQACIHLIKRWDHRRLKHVDVKYNFTRDLHAKGEIEDLKKELDDAIQGVIYFSLGSNVKSVNLTSRLKGVIASALSELPYKVLWKWESDHFPGKPNNVVIRQWLPQEGVLAHPNVKLFITQGGLQSMEEALFYKVPLLGMPFFGDQPSNINKMVQMGIGLEINRNTVTKEEMKLKILELINTDKYRQKIAELSDIAFDQPMTGVEKAVWWIEYVIRHKGARHLRNPLLDMPLYQYLFLDIIALVLSVLAFAIFVIVFAIKYLLKFIKSWQNSTKIKSS